MPRLLLFMELVMGVCALAAGSWPNRLALPLANASRGREKAPPGLFSDPPSDSLPSHFVWVMGVCAQSSGCLSCGLRSLLLALPVPRKTVPRTVF